MATGGIKKTQQTQAKTGVSLPLTIGAVALLLAFIGLLFYNYVLPHPPPEENKPLSPEVAAFNNWLHTKTKDTQGDFNKLSPEDQQKVQQGTHGMGPMVMQSIYKGGSN